MNHKNKTIRFPKRYIPSILSRKDKKKQRESLKKSKKYYKKGKYHTRKKVDSFKSKESPHLKKAKKIYKIDNLVVNNELAKKTLCSKKALNDIIKKGQGAYYSSGSRPNQSAHSWGVARLASSITGGKAAAVDYNILEQGCNYKSKALKLAKITKKKYKKGLPKAPKEKIKK